MRILFFLLGLIAFLPQLSAENEASEFAQIYYGIYQSNLAAEALEEDQYYQQAYEAYQDCLARLEELMRQYPDHQQAVVQRRRNAFRQALNRLEPLRAQQQAPSSLSPSLQPLPPEIQREIDQRDAIIAQLTLQRDELNRRIRSNQQESVQLLQEAQREATEAKAELARVRDAAMHVNETNQTQVEIYQAQIHQLTTQLQQADARILELETENNGLLTQLANLEMRVEEMESREQELVEERDQILERYERAGTEEGILLLAQENERITSLYQQLQEDFSTLKDQSEEDQALAARLKLQVVDLQNELDLLRTENNTYQQQLADMETHLASAQSQLALATSDADITTAQGENEFLRLELLRQQQRQAHRERMRDLLHERLAEISENSAELQRMVDLMVDDPTPSTNREEKIDLLLEQANTGVLTAASTSPTTSVDLNSTNQQVQGIQKLTQTASQDFTAGNYERALHSFDIILDIVPNDVPTLINRGVVLLRLDRIVEAEEDFKKALAQRPENSFARTMLGLCFLEQDRTDRAIEELDFAIAFNPGDPNAHFYRGLVAQQVGDISRAEAEYQETLTLEPSFASAHFNLASMLCQVEPLDKDRIRKHYLEATTFGASRDLHIESVLSQ